MFNYIESYIAQSGDYRPRSRMDKLQIAYNKAKEEQSVTKQVKENYNRQEYDYKFFRSN